MPEPAGSPFGILRALAVFEAVPDPVIEELAGRASVRRIASGDWLFREGGDSDALYVLLWGRLEVVAESESGSRRLRLLFSGDAVGELGVLTHAPRSASVRAVRESEVLRIEGRDLESLYMTTPGFAAAMLQVVSSHLWHRGRETSGVGRASAVAVMIDEARLPAAEIRQALLESLGAYGRVGVLADEPGADDNGRGLLLHEAEGRNDVTLLLVPLERVDSWWHFCLRQADSVVVVTSPRTRPPRELALVPAGQVAFVGEPGGGRTTEWLDLGFVTGHHQLGQPGRWDAGFARLARSLVGRSLGLVLSGGGARGFAHIGVLQVLDEAGIAVDRIGGCSMGAFVAASFAIGRTPEEIQRACRDSFTKKTFGDYTLPRVSVIRANRAEWMIRDNFGDRTFESTPISCFSVACDLVSGEVVVHRRGPLYFGVGVSIGIPGLAPPVLEDGRILVDGGVLDNLPVDKMPIDVGPVVAVDVLGKTWRPHTRPWETRPGKRGLMGHLALLAGRGTERLPTIAETIARATVLGSWRLAAENRTRASVVISPDVGQTSVMDWRSMDEMVAMGRRAALESLEELRQLV